MDRVISCAICGKLHEATGFGTVCPDCLKQDLAEYDRVRDFLYVHPRAKVFEVSTSLDIPVPKIKRYLREGRLEIIEKDNLFLKCEKCGKPICSGTLCDDCQKQSSHDYKSSYAGNGSSAKQQTKVSFLPSSRK